MQRSTFALLIGFAGVMVVWAAPSQADPWPQRTVRVIVPLPPGTSTDLAARLFAEKLAARWHQPVVIENRQGADALPAVSGFVSARDDHTLLCSFAGIVTINPLTYEKLPYDPIRDVVPVASIADNFVGIAASATLKLKSLDEFVELARAQPRKLSWAATPGVPLYALVALQNSTGTEMVQVSYRDFTPALQDVGEGRIHVIGTGLSLMLPQAQAGKIKLLMLNSRQRSPQAPEVPTASETGHPELTFDSVVGFYGWRDMRADLKERIAADVRAVAADPVIAARLANSGSALRVGTPAANKQQAVDILLKFARQDRKDIEEAYDYQVSKLRLYGLDGDVSDKTYEKMAEGLVEIGFIKKPYPPKSAIFDDSFVQRASN